MNEALETLDATAAAAEIRAGRLTSEALVSACLSRIEAREPVVGAWIHLDPERAIAAARRADERLSAGAEPGPLHGIPVGLKDIFDTVDLPTECGSAAYAGRRPDRDAAVVALLGAAGAVVLGKTVTTEFALSAPGKTDNPHRPGHTPGGSSSGSAAAVADCHVPLALGSQTGGSVLRPASFCGVFGYKPTFGSICRRGMHPLVRRLDHPGIFARSLADVALIGDALMRPYPGDLDLRERPEQQLTDALARRSEGEPRIAFVRTPAWRHADSGMQPIFESFVASLGNRIGEPEMPVPFDRALELQRVIMAAGIAATLGPLDADSPGVLREETRRRIAPGVDIIAADYLRTLDEADGLAQSVDDMFGHWDAIVTPASPGDAPEGLDSTGNPVFNNLWTMLGAPALSLPLLTGPRGLPMGVQLVGRRGDDAKLFQVASSLLPEAA